MPHRFGPRKGPLRREIEPDEALPADEKPPAKDPKGNDPLGKDLLGGSFAENLLGKRQPDRGMPEKDRPERERPGRLRGAARKKPGRTKAPSRRENSEGGNNAWILVAVGFLVIAGIIAGLVVGYLQSKVDGYDSDVAVQQATRLPWLFVLGKKEDVVPSGWKGYESTRDSSYELFVPPTYDENQTYPLVLFVAPGAEHQGWSDWSEVCQDKEIIYAGIAGDFNGQFRQEWKQVRLVLDVLDDVRRRYHVNTNRIYICGLGNAGPLACKIAFLLPEFFGGVVAIGDAGILPDESWIRQRVVDRLSVALVVGDDAPDARAMTDLYAPYLTDVKVRSKLWTVAGLGEGMPDAAELLEIYTWLEAGLPARQALAKQYPASRFSPKAAPTSDEWSQLVLEEAKQRLKKPETYFSGVMQLKGCANRWVGLPAAEAAGKLFTRVHLPRREAEWKAQEMADMLKHHHAAAQSFTRYLLEAPPLGKNYQRNRDWAKRAILYWNLVRNEDKTKSEEAQKQIEALEKFRKGQLTGMKE